MTEEEARGKWCPHVRCWDAGTVRNATATVRNLPESRCIGSACMAWRSGSVRPTKFIDADAEIPDGWALLTEDPYPPENGAKPRILIQSKKRVEDGYCGLAGKP